MENRLPLGFDPEVWKGWEGDPTGLSSLVFRHLNDLTTMYAFYTSKYEYTYDRRPAGEGISVGVLPDSGPRDDALFKGPEPEAAAFADAYAESHGGWA